jgi:hypothetical protein
VTDSAEDRFVAELERRVGSKHGVIDTCVEVMRDQGWIAPPQPGEVVYTFTAPETATRSLKALWVLVRAWEVAGDGLDPREKDRVIAYMVSLLNGEKRTQVISSVSPAPWAAGGRAR